MIEFFVRVTIALFADVREPVARAVRTARAAVPPAVWVVLSVLVGVVFAAQMVLMGGTFVGYSLFLVARLTPIGVFVLVTHIRLVAYAILLSGTWRAVKFDNLIAYYLIAYGILVFASLLTFLIDVRSQVFNRAVETWDRQRPCEKVGRTVERAALSPLCRLRRWVWPADPPPAA